MTDALDRKILSIDAMTRQRQVLREAGQSVVQCHGCFDIVHPGHIRYLRFARQLGDALIVSLTGDSQMAKGPDRPYIPQELRAENLAALAFVDFVVIDNAPTACELLTHLQPDVYVKGREYANAGDPRFERERAIVEAYGGRVVFHSGDIVFSSSRLIRSMEGDAGLEECRLRSLLTQAGVTRGGLEAALDRGTRLRAVVVGDLLREQTVICDATAASPDAPALLLQQLETNTQWAGAASVAQQLAALGAHTRLMTVANAADADATSVAAPGVEVHAIHDTGEARGRTLFVADDTRLFELNHGAPRAIDSRIQQQLSSKLESMLKDCDLLVWADFGGGLLSRHLIERTGRARRDGPFVAACAQGPRSDLVAMTGVDLLFASERRLRESVHDMTSSLPAACWNLLSQTRAAAALVGLHKRGLINFHGATRDASGEALSAAPRLQSAYIPNLCEGPIDLLGADEAAMCVAGVALATGADHTSATYLAAAAHGLVARRAGRGVVALADLQRWLAARPELRPDSRFLPDSATCGDIARLAPPLAGSRA